ncbi:MAG: hypothetical protein AABY32_07220 [Nanoarchaeota archaeon]
MVSKIREYLQRASDKYSAFFRGMGSLSIFPNNNYKPSWIKNNLTPNEQDYLAIQGDWEKVGDDMRISMNNFKKSLSNKLKN